MEAMVSIFLRHNRLFLPLIFLDLRKKVTFDVDFVQLSGYSSGTKFYTGVRAL
jgi:hypothetical protein